MPDLGLVNPQFLPVLSSLSGQGVAELLVESNGDHYKRVPRWLQDAQENLQRPQQCHLNT